MTELVDDIVQALKNLGGEGTLKEIYAEVERIRISPRTWPAQVTRTIELNSSESKSFRGQDIFRRAGPRGVALRNWEGRKPPHQIIKDVKVTKDVIARKPADFSLPESFETISNYLRTIKEYREYSSPTSSEWIEYIREFFHVMGFSTEELDSRHIILKDMVGDNTPKAVVGIIYPGENFEEMIPGIKWESHLLYTANYHHVSWGILTDGLQLKVLNLENNSEAGRFFWPDLDGIIENEKSEFFFPIYKVFSSIKGNGNKQPQVNRKQEITGERKNSPGMPKTFENKVTFEEFLHANRKLNIGEYINQRWFYRIVPEGLHQMGRKGAELYLNKYGRGILAPKVVQLALKAEMENCPEIALGFRLKAYELETGIKADPSKYKTL
jgi:hypothetical protein